MSSDDDDEPKLSAKATYEKTTAAIRDNDTEALAEVFAGIDPATLKLAAQKSRELGNEMFKSGNYQGALEQYTGSLTADQAVHQVWSNRSACLLALDRPEDALNDAKCCIQLKPDWAKGYFRAAKAALQLGRNTESTEFARQGLELEPKNRDLAQVLASARKVVQNDRQKYPSTNRATMRPDWRKQRKTKERVSADYSRFDNLTEDNFEELYPSTAADKASVDYGKFDTTVQQVDREEEANKPPPKREYDDKGNKLCYSTEDVHKVFHEMQAKQAEGANVPHDGVLFSYDMARQLALDTDYEDWNTEEPTALNGLVNLLSQISEVMAQTSQFCMLSTGTILAAYELAIKAMAASVADKQGAVLVLGVGTCVPALLAAKHLPNSEVIVITRMMSEITSLMPPMMLQLNQLNRESVRTFRGSAQMLQVDESNENAMKHHAAACIIDPDLFGFSLLSKGALRELHHLRNEVLAPDAVMVPAKAAVYAAAVGWKTPLIDGVDTSALHRSWWHAGVEQFHMQEHPWLSLLTEPVPLFKFDFSKEDPDLGMPDIGFQELQMQVHPEGGWLGGIMYWYTTTLADGTLHYTTDPMKPKEAFGQAVQWVQCVEVEGGSIITSTAEHNGTTIRFSLAPPLNIPAIVHDKHIQRSEFTKEMTSHLAQHIRDAVQRAIVARASYGEEPRVTIIQSGCGLLSVAAANAGAQVVGMERVPGLNDIASELCTDNKQSAAITSVKGDSRKLAVGEELPWRGNILVFNELDSGLLASGILALIDHAWSKQVSSTATCIPRAATLWAQGVQILHQPNIETSLNLEMWHLYKYTENYESIDAARQPHIALTEPFQVFDFNFAANALRPKTDHLRKATFASDHDLPVIADGVLNGVIFWQEVQLDSHKTINMCPGYDPEEPLHFQQAFQCLEPLLLHAGDTLPLQAEHSISDVKFAVDQSRFPDLNHDQTYGDRRTQLPLFDGRLVVSNQKLQDQFKKLTEGATFNKDVHEEAARTAIKIAMDPGALEGAAVDPGRASMLAMSLFP